METIQKFQDLLTGLFQFETSDLDFGIYRILNYKREQLRGVLPDPVLWNTKIDLHGNTANT